ncbi:hypothetical protein [Aneurinibacillus danicus]|uniref:Uncharacterized protein n=1 Tax=Aneurinibacillus danicus TaxID=267746 RepID=A0A511V487_9BACL|nr:hypothetical protein [Aneurinibacillus danicus]GEN32901.1 hypothetical protein ADA01nite_03610 [Aneurinibacillus danicus]
MDRQFDITLAHRLADQLVECATSLKETAQSPGQVQQHLVRLTSIVDSLHSLTDKAKEAGMNPLNDNGDIR